MHVFIYIWRTSHQQFDYQIQVVLLKIISILSFYNSYLFGSILTDFFPTHFLPGKQQLSKKKKISKFDGVVGIVHLFLQSLNQLLQRLTGLRGVRSRIKTLSGGNICMLILLIKEKQCICNCFLCVFRKSKSRMKVDIKGRNHSKNDWRYNS